MNINKDLKEYLNALDLESYIDLEDRALYIVDEITKILYKGVDGGSISDLDLAEILAFSFLPEKNDDDDYSGGEYYWLCHEFKNKSGQYVLPCHENMSESILKYWRQRSNKTKNLSLKSHYADLVIDFSPTVLKTSTKDIALIKTVIEANIDIYGKSPDSMFGIRKIRRALSLALQINDSDLLEKIKLTVLGHLDEAPADSNSTVHFCLEYLVLNKTFDKRHLSEKEVDTIIKTSRLKFEKIANNINKKNFWRKFTFLKLTAALLAQHYKYVEDEQNVLSVLEHLRKASQKCIDIQENLFKSNMYEQISSICESYQNLPKVKAIIDELSNEICKNNRDLPKTFKRYEASFKIDEKGIINDVFRPKDKLDRSIDKISMLFLPGEERLRVDFEEDLERRPFHAFSDQAIYQDGLLIAKSLSGEGDAAFVNYYKDQASYLGAYIGVALKELKKRFDKKSILDHLERSPIFSKNPDYLKLAITNYWNNKHIISSALFVPLIESGIRELVRLQGGNILTLKDKSDYRYKSLGRLLSQENLALFERSYKQRGKDVLAYFRCILTDEFGLNLRNRWAHGTNLDLFNQAVYSDLLFHIIILLSILRPKED